MGSQREVHTQNENLMWENSVIELLQKDLSGKLDFDRKSCAAAWHSWLTSNELLTKQVLQFGRKRPFL